MGNNIPKKSITKYYTCENSILHVINHLQTQHEFSKRSSELIMQSNVAVVTLNTGERVSVRLQGMWKERKVVIL